jgi:hypothetical protein
MSLLPPTSSFVERVEALFASVRGRGMALGPLDRVVLAVWAESGVPLRVVARGMLRAAERVRWMGTGGGVPRTLGACRPEVEEEIAAWKQRHLGAPSPLDEVFDTTTDGPLRPAAFGAPGLQVEVFDTAEVGSEANALAGRAQLSAAEISGRSVAPPGSSTAGSVLATSEPE